jgi:hypothetical protein
MSYVSSDGAAASGVLRDASSADRDPSTVKPKSFCVPRRRPEQPRPKTFPCDGSIANDGLPPRSSHARKYEVRLSRSCTARGSRRTARRRLTGTSTISTPRRIFSCERKFLGPDLDALVFRSAAGSASGPDEQNRPAPLAAITLDIDRFGYLTSARPLVVSIGSHWIFP